MSLQNYKFTLIMIILTALFLPPTIQTPQECVIEDYPKTRTFSSMIEYQSNRFSFNPHHLGYQGNVVEFNFTKLEVIPKNAFISFGSGGIVELNLTNKQIKKIDAGAFLGLECLNELNLSYNNLTDIAEGAFEGLDRLQNLLLNNNLLRSTPDSGMAFLHLTSLKILDLSRNMIKTIPRISFDALKKLEILNLGYNRLRFIDDTVFSPLENLVTLLLNNNYLTTINLHRWDNLGRLTNLDLADNYIINFDAANNFSFSDLKILNLSGNPLTVLNGNELKYTLAHLELLDIRNDFWSCRNLNDFISSIYGSKINIPRDIKCSQEDHTNLSLPTPPPKDLDEPKKRVDLNLIKTIKKNISNSQNGLVAENKYLRTNLHYVQNLFSVLTAVSVTCFLIYLFVKLHAWELIINSNAYRNYSPTNNTSDSTEMLQLIRR